MGCVAASVGRHRWSAAPAVVGSKNVPQREWVGWCSGCCCSLHSLVIYVAGTLHCDKLLVCQLSDVFDYRIHSEMYCRGDGLIAGDSIDEFGGPRRRPDRRRL